MRSLNWVQPTQRDPGECDGDILALGMVQQKIGDPIDICAYTDPRDREIWLEGYRCSEEAEKKRSADTEGKRVP